ncbi:MAG: YigZ family protein [Bacteroidales bacterium]|nr:YigZ family protein [Bacteroidales bacterium]MEE1021382.1 YigZ family protein [Bacteroidales bacterium]MEE1302231.1 YigZ family protein [Bacteroidales bacterium]
MAEKYLTVSKSVESIYKEKGSKFLSFLYPVTSLDEVKEYLTQLKKKYYDATHHCYAYIIGYDKETFRMNDDGEPSSTAGKPIYGQLQSNDLTNVLLVVVRYFGGTKLGVSGLIKAYKESSAECIALAEIVEKQVKHKYNIYFAYEDMNVVMNILKQNNAEQKNQIFDLNCQIEVLIDKRNSSKFESSIPPVSTIRIEFVGEE